MRCNLSRIIVLRAALNSVDRPTSAVYDQKRWDRQQTNCYGWAHSGSTGHRYVYLQYYRSSCLSFSNALTPLIFESNITMSADVLEYELSLFLSLCLSVSPSLRLSLSLSLSLPLFLSLSLSVRLSPCLSLSLSLSLSLPLPVASPPPPPFSLLSLSLPSLF